MEAALESSIVEIFKEVRSRKMKASQRTGKASSNERTEGKYLFHKENVG